jgi:hypothetical protein
MDPKIANLHEVVHQVIETTSAEHANQLRKQGWVVLSIRKAQDSAGEACLKYALARQRADMRIFDPLASNDSPLNSPSAAPREQKSSEG